MHLYFREALLNVVLLWILTTPHEFAHAWVGTKLGDDTPRIDGRLTLNPLAHIDWIGTALLPFATSLLGGGFIGWGKPVRSDISKLKGGLNGLAVVAMAGPFSNVIMAFLLAALAVGSVGHFPALAQYLADGVRLSLYLAIFNLLPIPPLDGSKLLLAARMPMAIYRQLTQAGLVLLVLAVGMFGIGRWMAEWSDQGARAILDWMR